MKDPWSPLRARADAGSSYDRLQWGMMNWFGAQGLSYKTLLADPAVDAELGRKLITEEALDGNWMAGPIYLYKLERPSPDRWKKLAEAGHPMAVSMHALDVALSHCGDGVVPEPEIVTFQARYLPRMDLMGQLDRMPRNPNARSRRIEGVTKEYLTTVYFVENINLHVPEICGNASQILQYLGYTDPA